MICRVHILTVFWTMFFLLGSVSSQAETIYRLDFSGQKDGNAQSWLKENDFKLQNDADEINARFKNGRLVLEIKDDINGLFSKEVRVEGSTTVRIEWGVDRYLKDANWENGQLREAIAVIVSFGDEKIASGSFVVPNVPYFIGIFLGQHEKEGKAYFGNYFKKGGRYFCSPCGRPAGELVVTEFNLMETFKREFGKSKVPYISSISFEIDARDTDGMSKAFIKSVLFLSP